MRKSELLRTYKKRIVPEAVLFREHPVPRGLLQEDMGMVTLRARLGARPPGASLRPRGHPKEKGKYPEQGFLLYFHLFLTSFGVSSLETVALYLYTQHTEIVKRKIKSLITILVGKVQIKGLCHTLHVNDR